MAPRIVKFINLEVEELKRKEQLERAQKKAEEQLKEERKKYFNRRAKKPLTFKLKEVL